MTRELVTLATVEEVHPIPDADQIEVCRIRGWDVVTKKGEFQPGDKCLYFEVDSMLDIEDERFAFLAPRGVRTDATGHKGHVLKTVRLRGQYSQGLALPVDIFPEIHRENVSLDESLNVVKWDPPIPASIAGDVKGVRPSWIPKTDEERIQNIPEVLTFNEGWQATEKIDGSSCTFYWDPDEEYFGVCSRNYDLKENPGNTLWNLAETSGMRASLTGQSRKIAVQGEAFGEGIQGNPLKVKGQHFRAFNVVLDPVQRLPIEAWHDDVLDIAVPVYKDLPFPQSVEDALARVENIKSLISPDRAAEGVVWRSQSGKYSFKVISNKYLLKHDR